MGDCARYGAPGAIKRYETPARAARPARAFEDGQARAGRRFHIATAPLWLGRRLPGR